MYNNYDERKQHFEALFENSSDCIAEIKFTNGAPRVQNVNPEFEEKFGYDAAEMRGKSIDDFIVGPNARTQADELNECIREGDRFEEEVERQTADGEIRTFRLLVIPVRTTGPDARAYVTYTDITASRRYTERLNALHAATRDLIAAKTPEEVAQCGVEAVSSILDFSISTVFFETESGDELEPVAVSERADAVFEDIGSLKRGEAVAWEVYESDESLRTADVRQLETIQSSETPISSELIVPLSNYGVLLIGGRQTAAFDDDDYTLAKILGNDIESALDRVTREQKLRAREQELAEQNERLETFANVIAHDLRNPLSVATGYLEVAQQEQGELEGLDRVDDALDRMDALIEDVLTVARKNNAIEETEQVDLKTLTTDAWATVETEGATLDVDGNVRLEVDRSRTQQLFENLFRNAVGHCDNDVLVTVGPLDNRGFFVEDTGPGIPEDERDEILEYGHTTDADGTGFGLAIVREIIEAHGGSLTVTESESGGARFEIRNFDTQSGED